MLNSIILAAINSAEQKNNYNLSRIKRLISQIEEALSQEDSEELLNTAIGKFQDHRNVDAVRYMLESPQIMAALQKDNPVFSDLLYLAAQTNNVGILQWLLDHEIPINDTGIADSLLQIAARHNCVEAIEFLIAHGADVNMHSDEDPSPLALAVKKGNFEAANALLNAEAKILPKAMKSRILTNIFILPNALSEDLVIDLEKFIPRLIGEDENIKVGQNLRTIQSDEFDNHLGVFSIVRIKATELFFAIICNSPALWDAFTQRFETQESPTRKFVPNREISSENSPATLLDYLNAGYCVSYYDSDNINTRICGSLAFALLLDREEMVYHILKFYINHQFSFSEIRTGLDNLTIYEWAKNNGYKEIVALLAGHWSEDYLAMTNLSEDDSDYSEDSDDTPSESEDSDEAPSEDSDDAPKRVIRGCGTRRPVYEVRDEERDAPRSFISSFTHYIASHLPWKSTTEDRKRKREERDSDSEDDDIVPYKRRRH